MTEVVGDPIRVETFVSVSVKNNLWWRKKGYTDV